MSERARACSKVTRGRDAVRRGLCPGLCSRQLSHASRTMATCPGAFRQHLCLQADAHRVGPSAHHPATPRALPGWPCSLKRSPFLQNRGSQALGLCVE